MLPVPCNQLMNSYLKEIADLCGIRKNLTTHTARHSYATLCLSMGVPIETIRQTLGQMCIRDSHTGLYCRLFVFRVLFQGSYQAY